MAKLNNKKGSMMRRSAFWMTGLALVALMGVGVAKLQVMRGAAPATSDQPTFTVEEGPLTIGVTEGGTIRPREQIILKNEVEGQTVVLFLVPEGTQVKKGDLLVELDASQLVDQRVNQQIEVINAESSYINARENLEVVKSQAQADIDKAALDLEFAQQDLVQYTDGEYPKLLLEANATITLTSETLTNAQNSLEWSKKLYDEKYLSEMDLKRDELTAEKARLDRELAEEDLILLENFTYKRKMTELNSNIKQMGMALERVTRKSAADIAQAEATLKAREAEYNQQKDRLDKFEQQIAKTKIIAPMDGTVIYASSTRSSFRGNEEPLSEGREVREREELIYLPTTSSYNAEIKVHETSLEKIRTGLPVRITVDALPGRSFTGRVITIAPLPDAMSIFMNPDLKIYNTTIAVDGDGADLRNGMSCRAEIVVDRYDKATYVPVQAVIRIGGKTNVYVEQGGRFVPRPVTIGLDNNRMIHITEGLKAGEKVMLAPPLSAGETLALNYEGELPAAEPASKPGSGLPPAAAATPAADGATSATTAGAMPGGGAMPAWVANMTPEQRAQMQERVKNMTPEQRAQMMQRMGGGGGRPGGSGGGRPGGGAPGGAPAGGGR